MVGCSVVVPGSALGGARRRYALALAVQGTTVKPAASRPHTRCALLVGGLLRAPLLLRAMENAKQGACLAGICWVACAAALFRHHHALCTR